MALDIYCGSLGRYYAHNWCNIEEQKTKGKEPGIEGERMTELCNLPISAEETGEVVLQWKEYITGQIQAHHNCPVDWAEDLNGDYATDRLSWENFGALIIWALHVEMAAKPPCIAWARIGTGQRSRCTASMWTKKITNPIIRPSSPGPSSLCRWTCPLPSPPSAPAAR